MPIPKDPIESAEAAKILRISVDNLHQRVHRQLVPAERIGRTLVFSRRAIEKLARTQNTKPGLAVNKQRKNTK